MFAAKIPKFFFKLDMSTKSVLVYEIRHRENVQSDRENTGKTQGS